MDEKIADVLEKVGFSQKDFRCPLEMSGGEQATRRHCRAPVQFPQVFILADEPTVKNPRPETSDEIMTSALRISRDYGDSISMATHDYPRHQ